MTYQETLTYLFSRLPMYQRVGKAAYKVNLDSTHQLCEELENPQHKFRSIHIAGTNGKGSTSHMIASVLQEAGYKVGLYTSPHLKDFRERIRINGAMIPEGEVVDFVEQHQKAFEKMDLSFFEWTVGLAFYYFAEQEVDIAVIETGMGGRLDSTNVITPEVTAITNISLDHTQFLGNTLSAIAKEKAGIIKSKVPLVLGDVKEKLYAIFEQIAYEKEAPIYFSSEVDTTYTTDLKGSYQTGNLKTAVGILQVLCEQGWKIDDEVKQNGLNNVVKNTGLLGRWQVLQQAPLTICDTGHNEAGVKLIVDQLKRLNFTQVNIVWGMVKDKEANIILRLLPKNATYYFCQAQLPRAMDASLLQKKALSCGLNGEVYKSVSDAYQAAKEQSETDDLIFIGGSTFVVAEVL